MNGEIDQVSEAFVGRQVVVDAQRPELARMAHKRGRVVAINANGRALVQFDGPDIGWHDIHPAFLKIVEEGEGEGE